MQQIIGIDPGGEGATGWAIVSFPDSGTPTVQTGCCTGAKAAIERIASLIECVPTAAGIDAPLYWTRQGPRAADVGVRALVRAAGGRASTVAHVNSLRGACLVQGVLAVLELRERWPSIAVTEAHPKALLRVNADARKFLGAYLFATDHERDAVLGGYAAVQFHRQTTGWKDWCKDEVDFYVPSGGPMAYWFPSNI